MMTPKRTREISGFAKQQHPSVCSLRMHSDHVCVQVHEVMEALAELM